MNISAYYHSIKLCIYVVYIKMCPKIEFFQGQIYGFTKI